jgi:hypothetical protein
MKLAMLAMAFLISISACAMEKGPVYLHIQNNTKYDWNISEAESKKALGTVKAGNKIEIAQLPWSEIKENHNEAIFVFANEEMHFDAKLGVVILPWQPTKIYASASLGGTNFTDKVVLDPMYWNTYKYHLFIIIRGNKKNSFDGSSIRIQAETELQKIEQKRIQERMKQAPQEESLERFLQMKRY